MSRIVGRSHVACRLPNRDNNGLRRTDRNVPGCGASGRAVEEAGEAHASQAGDGR